MSEPLTPQQIIAAIQQMHLKANIGVYESNPFARIYWYEACIDPGGTIFGLGPYLKVPVTLDGERTVHRVYPPERLRKRLAAWLSR